MVTSTNGFSDPEIYAVVKLWASDLAPAVGRRMWLSAVAGVKTPWGRNVLQQGGERVDEHAQSGTGSTNVFGGISAVYQFDPRSSAFASFQYRKTGTNSFDYKYGNVTIAVSPMSGRWAAGWMAFSSSTGRTRSRIASTRPGISIRILAATSHI